MAALLIWGLAACVPAGADPDPDPNFAYISGPVDQDMFDPVARAMSEGKTMRFASPGGSVASGLAISRIIAPRDIDIEIEGICLSACASLIMPSADHVTFINNPVIAFHGGGAHRRIFVEQFGSDLDCYQTIDTRKRDMYATAGRNTDFVDLLIDVHGYENVRFVDEGDDCPWIEFDLEVDMWFPTSAELRTLMGLDFTGTVCADDADCIRAQIRRQRQIRNTTVRVGNALWRIDDRGRISVE